MWLSNLRNSENSPVIQQSSIVENKSDNESSNSLKSSISNSSVNIKKNVKCFNLEISYRKCIKMKPITIMYGKTKKKKAYTILNPGVWANIINDEFLKNYKMPCTYIYKRCRVYNSSSSKYFLTFQGKCKDCGVNLHGWSPMMSPACSFGSITIKDLMEVECNHEINHQDFSDSMNVNKCNKNEKYDGIQQDLTSSLSPTYSIGSVLTVDEEEQWGRYKTIITGPKILKIIQIILKKIKKGKQNL